MSEAPAGWYPHPHQPGTEAFWDGTAWTAEMRPASVATMAGNLTVGPPVVVTPTPPRKAWLAATLIPIFVVVAVGVTLIVSHTTNPQATVQNAVHATLSKHSAEVTVVGGANIEGIHAPIAGTGEFSFDKNDGNMTLKLSVLGQHENEKAVYSGTSIYLNLGPEVAKILPGKTWVSLDPTQADGSGSSSAKLGTGSIGTGNPGSVLGVLAEKGNTVTDLGSSTINGVTVEGYAIKVNPEIVKKEIRRLPAWMRQAVAQVSGQKTSDEVFISGDGTVYRLTTKQIVAVSGQSFTEEVSMDFHNFGVPVTVTPPPPGQVGTYGNFLKAAEKLEGSQVN